MDGKDYIAVLDEYLLKISEYFDRTPTDIESPEILIKQSIELGKAVALLLKHGYVWQGEILKRTLGETSLLVFVIFSLKDEAKKAYFAVYMLQGWYEVLEVFEKFEFDEHKEAPWAEMIKKKIDGLTKQISDEFKESNNEAIDERKMRKFVRGKLSRQVYKDAEIIVNKKYKDFPEIKNSVERLLKGGGLYQAESNFVHSRFFASALTTSKNKLLSEKNIKTTVIDTVRRMHLGMTIYALSTEEATPLVDELTSIYSKIPPVFRSI